MNIVDNNGIITVENIPKVELDLDKTFDCGQAFRWEKHPKGFWYGVANNQIIALKQVDDKIYTNVKVENKDWFVEYLNLDMDYTQEIQKIDMTNDKYLKSAYEASKGIHILRQDLYEMIITFVTSQMNSMRNIRASINKLSKAYGTQLSTTVYDEDIVGYTFPTPSKIASLNTDSLRECSVGFRDKYIHDISKFIDSTPDYLDRLSKADYSTAMKMLKGFTGIGDKVANCICLFGLHHVQAFPIDTHIKQIIDKHYNGHINIAQFGDIAGIVQQYIFYYKAFCGEDN